MAVSVLTVEKVSAFAAATSTGSSIIGTVHSMVHSNQKSVVIGLEVSNATKYFLKSEGFFVAWGKVETPPVSILPGIKEVIIAHKSIGTATGTTGFAVWKVGDTEIRLVVMWSIPWNHNHHENVLALGFKEGEVKLSNDTYYEMYYGAQTWFKRQGYSSVAQPVEMTHDNKEFLVQGNMGTDSKCKAKVEFLPLTKDMVAECLRNVVFDYIEDPEPQKKD